MRLALALAAPFPLHQGSQVFVAEQARALRDAGASTTLFCYAGGAGEADPALPTVRTHPAWTPRTLRSSANPTKALADASLAAALVRAHRREGFDAVLAHNAEAAAAALLARPFLGIPIAYVAHTVLRHELATYGPPGLRPVLDAAGGWLERQVARRADAVFTLCEAARGELAPFAKGPVRCVPPGRTPGPTPTADELRTACEAHGVACGRFVLYAGNLDGYQELDLLDAAAARTPEIPVLVATHDARGAALRNVRVVEVASAAEARALTFACAFAVLPRRRPGGFPIKLLNYLEASRAVVAHEPVGDGLVHQHSAWLLADGADADAWAEALRTLWADPARARALGRAGRAHLAQRHAWPDLAQQTLAGLGGPNGSASIRDH